jgi:hypothetical protein
VGSSSTQRFSWCIRCLKQLGPIPIKTNLGDLRRIEPEGQCLDSDTFANPEFPMNAHSGHREAIRSKYSDKFDRKLNRSLGRQIRYWRNVSKPNCHRRRGQRSILSENPSLFSSLRHQHRFEKATITCSGTVIQGKV